MAYPCRSSRLLIARIQRRLQHPPTPAHPVSAKARKRMIRMATMLELYPLSCDEGTNHIAQKRGDV
jgi:hypothetical protein